MINFLLAIIDEPFGELTSDRVCARLAVFLVAVDICLFFLN